MSRIGSRSRGRMAGMRRWDGRSRITTDWFGYHSDPELNFSDGDVLVFLHEPGRSRRGASFRLHAEYLATTGFQCLVDQCVLAPTPTHWAMPTRPDGERDSEIHELYLPAPADADSDTVAQYHLTTRNFFAWLYDRPLTGKSLGASLVDVMARAQLYRPNTADSNKRDMLAYLDRRCYMDFRECADHALAALYLAENFQMETLWVNAFSHCVGMNHGLHASIEFDAISRVTKAKITRARLEMDIRLDRVARSVTTFFDNEISGTYLGFTETAKEHMDRFRSFLHAYYIESHGFWPPSGFTSSFSLRRSLYRSMYVDFRALYQYLVDPESTPSLQHNKPTECGMCTLQNIRAFDDRYRLKTLPHPLPLIPKPPAQSLPLRFTIRKRRMEREARNNLLMKSLSDASHRDSELMKSRLVRRYHEFEKQTIVDDFDPVNPVEGRKIRWILIYAIFHILASVISAPSEVRDTEGLSYPLCCQRPITMPWTENKYPRGAASPTLRSVKSKDDGVKGIAGRDNELRPDLDYITSQRNRSLASLTIASAVPESPDITSGTTSPTTSTSNPPRRSGLARFFQKRAMSSTDALQECNPATRSKNVSFHKTLVYGYGNTLNETIDDTPQAAVHSDEEDPHQQRSVRTTIDNSSFIKTATLLPSADQSSISHLTPSLSVNPGKTTPSPPLSAPIYLSIRADSPTVPTTPSNSRASSSNSTTSHISSNTSHSSDEDEEETKEEMENGSTTSTETATAPSDPKSKASLKSNTSLHVAALNEIHNTTISSKSTTISTQERSHTLPFGMSIPKSLFLNLRSPYNLSSLSINVIAEEEDVEDDQRVVRR